jgi:Putative zinc-finger
MPSEPRVPAEPTLEELSAYLDHELDAATQARIAEHVAGCHECRARLDGLRETVTAIRAMPMETPPRTFTIPEQRRQAWRWAPAGWIGGAAVALLLIAVGIQNLHLPASSPTSSTTSGGLAGQHNAFAPYGQVAPLDRSGQGVPSTAQRVLSANSKTVVDPQDSSRSLTISTDATSYLASGVITVQVTTRGLSGAEASSVKLFLSRESAPRGYAVRLMPPSSASTYPFDWEASYSISQMQLPAPVAGSYGLQVTIEMSNQQSLTASLPLTITP